MKVKVNDMIKPPAPRKSAAAVKPPVNKLVKPYSAEAVLKQQIAKGNTKNFDKTREAIAKKTGTWPNGYTN